MVRREIWGLEIELKVHCLQIVFKVCTSKICILFGVKVLKISSETKLC